MTLEEWSYIVGIISAIFVAGGTVVAVKQYLHQKKLDKIKEASKIAKYFEEEVIDYISMVLVLFSLSDNMKALLDAKKNDIETATFFNATELKTMFSQEEIDDYIKFLNEEISQGKKMSVQVLLSKTLNKLEHCAIAFNSGIADERAVYQSLHQVIFKLLPYAYIYIANLNCSNIDKYYTNLYIMIRVSKDTLINI